MQCCKKHHIFPWDIDKSEHEVSPNWKYFSSLFLKPAPKHTTWANVVKYSSLASQRSGCTMNSKLANAHRHMQPIIYGDRVTVARRWKFWICGRKRSWVRVRRGETVRQSWGVGGARWEDKGTGKLTASCSNDLPEGCTAVTGQFSASLRLLLSHSPASSVSLLFHTECLLKQFFIEGH